MGDLPYLTLATVMSKAIGLQESQMLGQSQHAVGRILQKLGYRRHTLRIKSGTVKVWLKRGVTLVDAHKWIDEHSRQLVKTYW